MTVRPVVRPCVYPCVWDVTSYGGADDGEVILAEYELTLGDIKLATKDGEAMFWDNSDTVDFSAYAGTDLGSTPYKVIFTDSADKTATAYCGAGGSGLALSANMLSNPGFETGDPPDDWSIYGGYALASEAEERTGGSGSACMKVTRPVDGSFFGGCMQSIPVGTIGSLYKRGGWAKNVDAGSTLYMYLFAEFVNIGLPATWTEFHQIKNLTSDASGERFHLPRIDTTADGQSALFDDQYNYKITDVPATGLHLMSAENGTTRNMTSVDSGFDPNTIESVQIWQL